MARLNYTVQNLIDEVRDQLDELNTDSIPDRVILNTLNRGQDFAFDILARRYPEPILKYDDEVEMGSGETEIEIPEDCFEDRVLAVEFNTPGKPTPVKMVSFSDLRELKSVGAVPCPSHCAIVGRDIVFNQPSSGTYDVCLWYLRDVETLVKPQGRITVVNENSNYVVVDAIGDDLETESDQLNSYVNLVDGQTGEIKRSMQIQSISGNRVTFRSSPLRSTVLNRTISSSLGTSIISPDDYICVVEGTCVPYYGRPTNNFLIQFSTAENTRKLGGDAPTEEQVLEKFEKQMKQTYARRPTTFRVKKKNASWNRLSRWVLPSSQ